MSVSKDNQRLELLRAAPLNSWVAPSEDETRLVAIGESYEDVVNKSEALGVSDPVIMKTPPQWLPLAV